MISSPFTHRPQTYAASAVVPWAPKPITFVLHDAGETKAMMPVFERLEASQTDYRILATATAEKMLAHHPKRVIWPKAQTNGRSSVSEVAEQHRYQEALNADVVVTGLVSAFQKQWAHYFKARQKHVIGFYDAFHAQYRNNPAQPILSEVNEMMVPSRDLAQWFQRENPGLKVTVLGQPALDQSLSDTQNTPRQEFRSQLGLSDNHPTVLFVGGYGPSYEPTFREFCKTLRDMPGFQGVVSLHPSQPGGELEKFILAQEGMVDRIRILPKDVNTSQATALSDVVVTQGSTVGMQALFSGKPVILLGPVPLPDQMYQPLSRYGLVSQAQGQQQLQAALLEQATHPKTYTASDLSGWTGIPLQASKWFSTYLSFLAKAMPKGTTTRQGLAFSGLSPLASQGGFGAFQQQA